MDEIKTVAIPIKKEIKAEEDHDSFKEQFTMHIEQFSTAPFLFIGSGMSRRYLGIETWSELLKKICDDLHIGPSYNFYYSKANHDLPLTAKLIGDDLIDIWWKDDRFKESRNKYSDQVKTKYCPLKFEISEYLNNFFTIGNDQYFEELQLFKKINVDGIITTNWDVLLEDLFSHFTTHIGQESLLFSEYISVGEIYKIHGSINDPTSLILTSDDYSNFNEKYPYLAAKLLTIFVEQPVVFLGYSLQDSNIQEILKSIITCLSEDNITKLQDRLIFCNYDPDCHVPVFTESTLMISGTVLPIKLINLSSFKGFFEVLANNKKRLPIKILRNMQDMVFEFVKSSKSTKKIYVSDDLDELQDSKNVEFVYGVGIQDKLSEIGYKAIKLIDLYSDIISDEGYVADKVSRNILPNINARYIPYFKYLRNSGYLNEKGEIPESNDIIEFSPSFISIINSIDETSFQPSGSYLKKKNDINNKYKSFSDLVQKENFLHILVYTPCLEINKIDLDNLLEFLIENWIAKNHKNTNLRKLICLYDYLKYGLGK